MKEKKTFFALLLSPWAILCGVGIGVFLGTSYSELGWVYTPIGNIYLSLLKMCVLPIMISAIITSVARLLSSGVDGRLLWRIGVVFCCGMFFASAVGVICGVIGQPGTNLNQVAQRTLGQLIRTAGSSQDTGISADIKIYLNESEKIEQNNSLEIISSFIPENIFNSLSNGENLQVLFFSLLLGTALSLLSATLRDRLVDDLDTVFSAFELIISKLIYMLPFGLCFLIASQISSMGLEVLFAMTKLVIWIYASCLIIIIVNAIILSFSSQFGFIKTITLLKDPLLIAFFTRYGYAAMPTAIEVMHHDFKIKKNTANLILPIGITICRYGSVMVFAISAIFLAQLFAVELNASSYIIIFLGAVLAGIASAGTPGVVGITMISIILTPLGLPLEVAVVLLLAVDPLTDPVLTLTNVHSNCAACGLIACSSTDS